MMRNCKHTTQNHKQLYLDALSLQRDCGLIGRQKVIIKVADELKDSSPPTPATLARWQASQAKTKTGKILRNKRKVI
jgi:hypothetical protein